MAPMRDDIKVAIEAGGATKESLLELTGTTEKGLASQFTYMRMMGNCPMKQEDGTFKIVTAAEWEAHKADAGSRSTKVLTPEERVERGEKRSKRAASAYDSAKKRLEANPYDRLTELKFIKAEAELEIAEIELGKAEEAFLKSEGASEVADEDTDEVIEDFDEDPYEDPDEDPDVDDDMEELNFDD
jgi:hypothetical protein